MATQSYYEPHAIAAAKTPPPVPGALRWFDAVMVAVVLLLVALPVIIVIDRDGTLATIAAARPDLGPAALDVAYDLLVAYAVGWHALCGALWIWFTARVRHGRRWARLALTALLLAVTGFSVASASVGGVYLGFALASDVLHVLALGLLWLPSDVRTFFAAHRSGGQARTTAH